MSTGSPRHAVLWLSVTTYGIDAARKPGEWLERDQGGAGLRRDLSLHHQASRSPLSHICISTYVHTHKPVDSRTVTLAPSGTAQLMVAMVT